ncbi:hypothetical protein CMV_004637 [Castanea mollissima]|uniref:Uncharacterized protein n=1 Tax=Castanea mollissima TaxID=60419 RepID=A0A8J4RP62_9ROSI|nr:hypothetical protein CMV_004637 [Castanea mollissima]
MLSSLSRSPCHGSIHLSSTSSQIALYRPKLRSPSSRVALSLIPFCLDLPPLKLLSTETIGIDAQIRAVEVAL